MATKPATKKSAKKSAKRRPADHQTPPASDWRTTDQDEILRRIQRARDEKHSIANLHPEHPIFSTFAVKSPSGMTYQVEIRDLNERGFSCACPDFRTVLRDPTRAAAVSALFHDTDWRGNAPSLHVLDEST